MNAASNPATAVLSVLVDSAWTHLQAASGQAIPSDDPIIAQHVRDALAAIRLARDLLPRPRHSDPLFEITSTGRDALAPGAAKQPDDVATDTDMAGHIRSAFS